MGYRRIILKSDNEVSIKALKDSIKAAAKTELSLEEGKTGDKPSTGSVESAVKETKRQCRAMKSALEEKLGKSIPDRHAIWTFPKFGIGRAVGKTVQLCDIAPAYGNYEPDVPEIQRQSAGAKKAVKKGVKMVETPCVTNTYGTIRAAFARPTNDKLHSFSFDRKTCYLENVSDILSAEMRPVMRLILEATALFYGLLEASWIQTPRSFDQEFSARNFVLHWATVTGKNCGIHVGTENDELAGSPDLLQVVVDDYGRLTQIGVSSAPGEKAKETTGFSPVLALQSVWEFLEEATRPRLTFEGSRQPEKLIEFLIWANMEVPREEHRFLTDPDTPGVEKLVISACRPEANICPPHNITNADICCNDKRGLEPMNLMYVKGWSRSLAALTVLVCMWDCPEFKQEWNSSHKVMAGVQVGPKEAAAAFHLLKCIDDDIVLSIMQDTVPPIDLERVALFRSAIKKFEKQVSPAFKADLQALKVYSEKQQQDANRQAGSLRCFYPQQAYNCNQGGLDLQYLTQRFQRGQKDVEKFMAESHKYECVGQFSDVHANLLDWQSKESSNSNSPYNEWGRASFDLQLANLRQQDGDHLNWHFCAYSTQEDGGLEAQAKLMHGQIYRDWWDNSEGAGPKTRARSSEKTSLPTLPAALADSLGDSSMDLKRKIEEFNQTCCLFSGQGQSPTVRLLARAPAFGNAKLELVACKDYTLYLLNTSDSDTLHVPAGELCGFGAGSFAEVTPGVARNNKDHSIPWLLDGDTQLLIYTDGDTKRILCLAQIACACGTIASIGEANEAKAAAPGCPYAPTFDSSADQVSQQVSPYRLLRQLCA
ncbi:unnamed protein product [Durusdinium trenchii]|uniref:Uncharacterized protein n=1 Tax=Durusdinium trenchii TaxID=1381693 RepID=A0ABP0H614_9DINO